MKNLEKLTKREIDSLIRAKAGEKELFFADYMENPVLDIGEELFRYSSIGSPEEACLFMETDGIDRYSDSIASSWKDEGDGFVGGKEQEDAGGKGPEEGPEKCLKPIQASSLPENIMKRPPLKKSRRPSCRESVKILKENRKEWKEVYRKEEISGRGLKEESPRETSYNLAQDFAVKQEKRFSQEVHFRPELEEKMKEILLELLESGVSLRALHEWLNAHINLSRITITDRFKIILDDYDNIEIKMGPLPKTVFLFYLRHPEGVSFNYLQDFREEFVRIYSLVSAYDDPEKIGNSIDRLLDPLDNSICEKCSAVKKAFLKCLDPSIARYYCIIGELGKEKSILIDRELVNWQARI